MNIAVIGVGGVGGYFGGKLTSLLRFGRGPRVYFIARGAHLEAIRAHGLLLDTDEGEMICRPTRALEDIAELPRVDLCLLGVKGYSLREVLIPLTTRIHGRSMILPLLNGIDIYERIRSVIPRGIVFPACVYVGTHIERPGKVTQRGGSCTIHFGRDPNNDFVNPRVFDMLRRSNIKYSWSEYPYTEIWSKFIIIASFGLVTANSSRSIGEVMRSEDLSGQVKNIMTEIHRIAMKKRISLPASILEDSYTKGSAFPFELKTSFQRDYEDRDRPDERDIFGGAIIRMGRELGVDTPATEAVYESIQRNKAIA